MATWYALDMVSNYVVLGQFLPYSLPPVLNAPEKTRVFRIEETFPSPARSPARTTKASNDSSLTTKTPPPPRDALSTPNTPSPLTPTVAATPSYVSQPAAFDTPQPLPQPQAVIVPHYVPQQSPVPFVMPQVSRCNVVVWFTVLDSPPLHSMVIQARQPYPSTLPLLVM